MNKKEIYSATGAALLACLVAAGTVCAAADKPADRDENALIAVLTKADSPPQDKAVTCKKLAICGTKAAVPALAALLSDEKLASWARIGLEAIPDPAVDDAFRDALGRLQGRLLVGVINSIGMRGDVKAVEVLVQKLKDADVELAAAAAAALGRIGGEQATQALLQALAGAAPAALPAVCEGCLRNADLYSLQGRNDRAAEICERVRVLQVPRHIRMQAMRGLIVAKQAAGIPVLVEQLRSDDSGMVAVALGLAHEMPGAELTKALAAEVAKLSVEKQVYVIEALGVRGDKSVVPTLLALTGNCATSVCVAAINALKALGDAAVLPKLAELAVGPDGEVANAAQSAIAGFAAVEADATGVAMLASGEAKVRAIGADLISRRATYSAMPAVGKAAREDSDPAVRVSCINALRELGSFSDLTPLVEILLKNRSDDESQAAEKAMATICGRQTDAGSCAERLIAGLEKAGTPQKCALLRILRSVGGPKALQAVKSAMAAPEKEVQDVATRMICDWSSADAAPGLLELAKSSPNSTYKILALRGYIRLSGGNDVAGDARFAMFKAAEELIQRDDERKILLGALSAAGDVESFRLAAAYLARPALDDEARLAAVSIGERLNKKNAAEVTPVMEKVLASEKPGRLADRAKSVMQRMK